MLLLRELASCDIFCILLCILLVNTIAPSFGVKADKTNSTSDNRLVELLKPKVIEINKVNDTPTTKMMSKHKKRLKLIKLKQRDLEKQRRGQDVDDYDISFAPLPGDPESMFKNEDDIEAALGIFDPEDHFELPIESHKQISFQRLDQSNDSASSGISSNELERLVRNQVALAAGDWATLSPPMDMPPVEDYHEKLASIDPNATATELAVERHNKRPKEKNTRFRSSVRHANHNYEKNDQEINNGDNKIISDSHLASGSWHNDIFAILRPTKDPMTTSSDKSGDFVSVEHTPSPNLIIGRPSKRLPEFPSRLGGLKDERMPINSIKLSKISTSPKIVKTFQSLDPNRNQDKNLTGPLIQRTHDSETSGAASVLNNALPGLALQSISRVGSVSSDGYMDLPMQILSNAQQLVDSNNLKPTESSSTSSSVNEEKSHHVNVTENSFRNSFGNQDQGHNPSNRQAFTGNLNGDLAARLNANRYKNRISNHDIAANRKQQVGEPLSFTINRSPLAHKKNDQHTMYHHLLTSTPSALPLTSSMNLDSVAQNTRNENQNTRQPMPRFNPSSLYGFSKPTRPTTRIMMTAGATATTTPSTTTTSEATLSPNLISAIYAAALNNTRFSLPKKLAHHHLHSHVHSIKPAIISIPEFKASLPAFNPYESILAAAAAAAAAATATTSRNRIGKVGQGQDASIARQASVIPNLKIVRPVARGRGGIVTSGQIPIGGGAPSLLKLHKPSSQQQVGGVNPVSSPSTIFSSLLDSVNRGLRQVAGGTGGRQSSLVASNSDQVTSTHHDPNQGGQLSPAIYSPTATQHHLLQRGGNVGRGSKIRSLDPGISMMEFTDSNDPTSHEIVGLHQVGDEDDTLLTSYLANLLANQQVESPMGNLEDDKKQLASETFLSTMEPASDGPLASSLNSITQNDLFGWDSNATSGLPSILPEGVIFAPMGGNSNMLYPIFAPHLGGGAMESSKSLSNLEQLYHVPQFQAMDHQKVKSWLEDRPVGLSAGFVQHQTQPPRVLVSGGRSNPIPLKKQLRIPTNTASANGRPVAGSVVAGSNKVNRLMANQLEQPPEYMMPYAISHYMEEHRQLAAGNPKINGNIIDISNDRVKQNEQGPTRAAPFRFDSDGKHNNGSNPNQLVQGIFDEKEVVRFVVPSRIQFIASDGVSANRKPHSGKQGNITGSRQSTSKQLQVVSANPNSVAYSSQVLKMHQPRSVRPITSLSVGDIGTQNVSGAAPQQLRITIGTAGAANHEPQSWRPLHHHLVNLNPGLSNNYNQYQVYPGEVLHQALAHASSSLRPHLLAAGDLLHQHGQDLTGHHYLQHHHHNLFSHDLSHQTDMATSESARMAAIAAGPARWPLISHIWPLALALLPLMILVSIVAQIVMAAPLVMFTLTTLTVSKFAGLVFGAPPIASRREASTTVSFPPTTTSERSMTPEPMFPSQTFLTNKRSGNMTIARFRRHTMDERLESQFGYKMDELLGSLEREGLT